MTSGVTISICLANAQIGMFAGRVKSEQVSSSPDSVSRVGLQTWEDHLSGKDGPGRELPD